MMDTSSIFHTGSLESLGLGTAIAGHGNRTLGIMTILSCLKDQRGGLLNYRGHVQGCT